MTKITREMLGPPSITKPDSVEPASKEQVDQLTESVADLHRKMDIVLKHLGLTG